MSNEINDMFSTIAENYDRVNKRISLGADTFWRRRTALKCIEEGNGIRVLDIATGTADLAIAIADEARKRDKKVNVTGLDFNQDMLDIGNKKLKERSIKNVKLVLGDALVSGLGTGAFDVITSGFALRSFDSLQKFMDESYRLLKPGGRFVHLDAARPDSALQSMIMRYYYFKVVPAMTAKYNGDAYMFLASSVWSFDKDKVAQIARRSGFKDVKITNIALSVFMLTGRKPGKKTKQ